MSFVAGARPNLGRWLRRRPGHGGLRGLCRDPAPAEPRDRRSRANERLGADGPLSRPMAWSCSPSVRRRRRSARGAACPRADLRPVPGVYFTSWTYFSAPVGTAACSGWLSGGLHRPDPRSPAVSAAVDPGRAGRQAGERRLDADFLAARYTQPHPGGAGRRGGGGRPAAAHRAPAQVAVDCGPAHYGDASGAPGRRDRVGHRHAAGRFRHPVRSAFAGPTRPPTTGGLVEAMAWSPRQARRAAGGRRHRGLAGRRGRSRHPPRCSPWPELAVLDARFLIVSFLATVGSAPGALRQFHMGFVELTDTDQAEVRCTCRSTSPHPAVRDPDRGRQRPGGDGRGRPGPAGPRHAAQGRRARS